MALAYHAASPAADLGASRPEAAGCGYVLSPEVTRVIATIFAAATLSDFVNGKLADRA